MPQADDSQRGSLLGPAFDDDEIGDFLDRAGAEYRHCADDEELCETVAALVGQGKGRRLVSGPHGVRPAGAWARAASWATPAAARCNR